MENLVKLKEKENINNKHKFYNHHKSTMLNTENKLIYYLPRDVRQKKTIDD